MGKGELHCWALHCIEQGDNELHTALGNSTMQAKGGSVDSNCLPSLDLYDYIWISGAAGD